MLYSLLKVPARIAFHFYCRKLTVTNGGVLEEKGPLLIAANHPNSFLDAIILATLFKKPIYSLVRGDVYSNSFYTKLLTALKMLPVYRISEGVENLESNYETFEKCKSIFKQGGIVLIFCEGRCINEWKLRPLKKGTARLALSAWEENIPVRVVPAGINYSSFRKFGKNIHLHFDKKIENYFSHLEGGRAIAAFNEQLNTALKPRVYEIDEGDKKAIADIFSLRIPLAKKIVFGIPALAGALFIAPLYFPVRALVRSKWNNDHFDSIIIAILFGIFPFYLLLFTIFSVAVLPGFWGLLAALVVLLCLIALLQIKES